MPCKIAISRVTLFVTLLSDIFCPVASSIWFLSGMKLAALGGSAPAAQSTSFCDMVPGLTERQRRMCQLQPDAMQAVERGVHMAVAQCQTQFQKHRWNCTTYDRAGYGSVLFKAGSREAAYVYATTAAGVVHSVARACSSGEILGCGCAQMPGDGKMQYHEKLGPFRWGGCGDNLKFAASFARRFMDSHERQLRSHPSALMNLHNNRVGRRIVRKTAAIRCKCHGVSGACTARTCWRVAAPLYKIGLQLQKKYLQATQAAVIKTPKSKHPSLVPAADVDSSKVLFKSELNDNSLPRSRRRQPSKIKKRDLVFLEPSPDYCEADFLLGSLGTAGRRCSLNASAADSCDSLCCGRGYTTDRTVVVDHKCNCTFVWCCKVVCHTCRREVDIHTCNGGDGGQSPHVSMYASRPRGSHVHDSALMVEGNVILRDAAQSWKDYRRLRDYR